MRLDDVNESDQIEDRRGSSGFSGVPGGTGGPGIGTNLILGVVR